MVELIDNSIQFLVTLFAGIGAGVLFYMTRKQAYFLLACFFVAFALGSLYWTLYILLFDHPPQIFYVSELGWIASSIFLLTLVYTLSTAEERRFKHPAVWLVPVFILPQLVVYLVVGDIIINLLITGFTLAVAWFSVRGLFYARQRSDELRNRQYFHVAVLAIIFLEYTLWTVSCFWTAETLANPYYWVDFLLTAALLALLPATRKAVGL